MKIPAPLRKRATAYYVVRGDIALFEELAGKYAAEGWLPVGGVAVCYHYDHLHYAQAFTKTEFVDEPFERPLREGSYV